MADNAAYDRCPILHSAPVEIAGELIERCPNCGAYDWSPEPVKL